MRNFLESLYIKKRIIKGKIHSLVFIICRMFPIEKNLVSVCTFEGKGGMGCNAKPIIEELHRRNGKYSYVWFVNDISKKFPDYIKPVSNNLWNRAYYLARAKIWIDNYRKPLGTIKRKGQYYLNVNHYTIGVKSTGLLRGAGFSEMARIVSQNDSDMIDHLVIDSKWCEECFDKGFVYDGEYLITGAPRCDVLYGDKTKYRDGFRKKHNLPSDARVVMYAPTFREGAREGKRFVYLQNWSIDFTKLIYTLEDRFPGKWYICIRVHPQLAYTIYKCNNEVFQDRLIDESQADDMYEILAGMDAYITDYSSAIFEAGFGHIPAFIFADDIEKYTCDRGSLMWDFSDVKNGRVVNNKEFTPNLDLELPFPVATNNEELVRVISGFDQKAYDTKLDVLHKKINLQFDGNATKKLADEIEKRINGDR